MRTIMIGFVSVLFVVSCRQSREEEREPRTKSVEPRPAEPRPGEPRPGEMPEPRPMEPTTGMDQQPKNTIVAVARNAGNFNTLLSALSAAGMEETLAGPGPFTVFAPTDEAFAKVPKEQLDALIADKEQLRAVLANHVIEGKVLAQDITAGKLDRAKMMSGKELPIDTKDGVKIGSARVIQPDVMASNGVIHVIDTVLVPREGTEPQARAGY